MTPLFVGRLEQRPIYLAKIVRMSCCSIIGFERNLNPLDQSALKRGRRAFRQDKGRVFHPAFASDHSVMFGVQIGSVINKIQIVAEACPSDEPGVNAYRFRPIHAAIVPNLCQIRHAIMHELVVNLCGLMILNSHSRRRMDIVAKKKPPPNRRRLLNSPEAYGVP